MNCLTHISLYRLKPSQLQIMNVKAKTWFWTIMSHKASNIVVTLKEKFIPTYKHIKIAMLTEVQYPEKVNVTVVINVVFNYNFVYSMVRWIRFCVYVSRNVYVHVYIHVYKMNANKYVYVHFTYVILISTLFFVVEKTNKQNRAPNYLQCFEEGLAKVDSMILASVSKLRGQQKVVEECTHSVSIYF